MNNSRCRGKNLPPHFLPERFRPFPLDGKLLFFDRDTGWNFVVEGAETAHFRQKAPRTILLAITNACNLSCAFCYRDLTSTSDWNYADLVEFCIAASRWGVLEIAFGGGEPTAFRRFPALIAELYERTQLCLNFTTNGTLLSPAFFKIIRGKLGMIRLSLYDNNSYSDTIKLLVSEKARFGVNWLISPENISNVEPMFWSLVASGVRDFLFLSYKGNDSALHLDAIRQRQLSEFLNRVQSIVGDRVSIKIDVCWGNELKVEKLFNEADCGAGRSFISITSDKRMKQCSFQATGEKFSTLADVKVWWQNNFNLHVPAYLRGCARLSDRGQGIHDENFHIQSVQQ